MPNELDEFLKDTNPAKPEDDLLDKPFFEEPKPAEGELKPKDEEDDDEERQYQPKNRRERRLQEKYERERQSAIELAQIVEAMSDSKKAIDEADYLKGIERIYGTDSAEAQMATNLLREALLGVRRDAEESAYNRVKQEQEKAIQAEREATEELDSMVDEIEDAYNVSLTQHQERKYFTLLQKMSPKDREGNIVAYADPHAVWEVFQSQQQSKTTTTPKAKELANRSATHSTMAPDNQAQDDQAVKTLRELGII